MKRLDVIAFRCARVTILASMCYTVLAFGAILFFGLGI